MKKLLFYKSILVSDKTNFTKPGIEKFSQFFELFTHDPAVDRTGTLKLPVNVESLFPMPKYQKFEESFEDICNKRADFLIKKSEEIRGKIYVFYSGGIDSTLVVVSFLKRLSEKQKENLVILLSEESISENPNFYNDFILGKINVGSSFDYPLLLGSNNIFVTGEHNDQIFGAASSVEFLELFGSEEMHGPYNREKMLEFFDHLAKNTERNKFLLNLFEKLCKNAPIKITSNFEFLWWIYFSLKWQAVFMSVLINAVPGSLSREYLFNNYFTFYNTDEFQLWSMNNLDKKIKNNWKSYKWVCKDIIYNFNKDKDYRDNKIKISSLGKIRKGMESTNFIDSGLNFYKDLSIEEYYNPDNDFI
jgi:hypothetical protein